MWNIQVGQVGLGDSCVRAVDRNYNLLYFWQMLRPWNIHFKIFIDIMNSIKRETDSINTFNESLCSDISKDEDCLFFPDCNPAARLPYRLVFCRLCDTFLKEIIKTNIWIMLRNIYSMKLKILLTFIRRWCVRRSLRWKRKKWNELTTFSNLMLFLKYLFSISRHLVLRELIATCYTSVVSHNINVITITWTIL